MELNAQELLLELQTLMQDDPANAEPRLRRLADALLQAMETDRRSPSGITLSLAHQAINYIHHGLEAGQNDHEIKRRFGIAIRRAESWAMASAQAHPDDPRLTTR